MNPTERGKSLYNWYMLIRRFESLEKLFWKKGSYQVSCQGSEGSRISSATWEHVWISGCSLLEEELDDSLEIEMARDTIIGIISCLEEWRDPSLDRRPELERGRPRLAISRMERSRRKFSNQRIFASIEIHAARFARTVQWSHCALLLAVTVSVQWMNSSVALDDSNRSAALGLIEIGSEILPPLLLPLQTRSLIARCGSTAGVYRGGNSDSDRAGPLSNTTSQLCWTCRR